MARTDYQLNITARDNTNKAFRGVAANLKKMRASINQTVGRVGRIGAAFAVVGAAAGAAMVKMRMQAIDSLAKTADKLGVTTEALAGFRHAAELSGVSTQQFDKALQNMGVQIANAAQGTGLAVRALNQLGLNAIELTRLPLDQQMLQVAKAMENVENHSDRVRIAYELFGARGVGVLNMMKNGADAMEQMAQEAEQLGIALNRVDAAQIEAANDNVTRAKGVFEGFANQVTVALSPAIAELAANFYQVALDTNEAGSVGQRVAEALFTGFGHVANAVKGIRIAVNFVQLGFATFMQMFLNGVAKIGSMIDWLIDKYNKLAGALGMDTIDIGLGENISMLADSFGEEADNIRERIAEALNEPLPSDAIMQWFDDVQMKARETAEVVAANAPAVAMAEGNEEGVKALTYQQLTQQQGQQKLTDFNNKTATEQTKVVLDEATSRFQGIAATNKKLFAVQKAMQIGQAIMNTYTSASKTMAEYPFPINVALAALTVASGMAQVAQIRAQSFEGGGFTGFGARVGGVDGRGGMPAIVHPNETIIDHAKNQDLSSRGASITFNIQANDAAGFDELLVKRRALIVNMVNKAVNNSGRRSLT